MLPHFSVGLFEKAGAMMIERFSKPKTVTWLATGLIVLTSLQDCCLGGTQESGQIPPEKSAPAKPDPVPSPRQDPGRGLGATASPDANDPLIVVLELMKESQSRLAQKDTGTQTQQIQNKIIDVFDSLMNQAMRRTQPQPSQGTTENSQQQQQKETSQTAQAQPTQSDRGSDTATQSSGGDTKRSELNQVLQKVWGELPERERNMVLQHAAEAIVPKYRALIEAYYRELSRGRESSP